MPSNAESFMMVGGFSFVLFLNCDPCRARCLVVAFEFFLSHYGCLGAVEWVVQALESNSALPSAVEGSRGGSGGDAWRDESDEDEDEGQEPVEEVGRRRKG